MFRKTLILSIATSGILGAAYGCSSSTSNPSNTATGSQDSGTTSVTDGSTGSTDAPSSSSDDAAAASEDAGPTCPANVGASDIPTYAAATPTLGDCSSAQIADFITACAATTSTNKTCDAWFNDATNTTCGNCIAPVDANGNPLTGGPTLVNPTTQDPLTNTPGCVALEDPTHGAACATPLANYEECEDVACSQCTDDTSYGACTQSSSVTGGTCASYYSSFSTACAAEIGDGGIASANGECQDLSFVVTLYCGGGDGGVVADAGDGGDGG